MLGAVSAPSAPATVPAPRALDEAPRLRVCSLSGLAGSALVLVAYFLPWARVDPGVAADFRERVASSPIAPSLEVREDWERLAAEVERTDRVTGLDVFYWARTALATADSGRLPGDAGTRIAARGIHVATIWLAAVPALAVLLLLYFLLHHCRKARSPALILATLVGAAAVTITAVYAIVQPTLQGVATEPGMTLLLVGGALLFLAGTFGVRLGNWWRVLGGAAAIGAVLVAGILHYVRG